MCVYVSCQFNLIHVCVCASLCAYVHVAKVCTCIYVCVCVCVLCGDVISAGGGKGDEDTREFDDDVRNSQGLPAG